MTRLNTFTAYTETGAPTTCFQIGDDGHRVITTHRLLTPEEVARVRRLTLVNAMECGLLEGLTLALCEVLGWR